MKFNKKTIGWALLILASLFFSPFVGPDDIVGLQLYSFYSGIDVGFENLSEIYLDYFIFTTVISIILLFLSMHFLGWTWKRLWKKLDIGKYKIALFMGICIAGLFAFIGTEYAYILMGLVAFGYYAFFRKDKSEALAVFITPFILYWTGFTNLVYYVLNRLPIPEVLILSNPVIEFTSKNLGFETITNVSLIISVLIGFLIVFLITKALKEKF